MALGDLVANKAASLLRRPDGQTNWKVVGILGLGVALLAAVMGYRQENGDKKKAEVKEQ